MNLCGDSITYAVKLGYSIKVSGGYWMRCDGIFSEFFHNMFQLKAEASAKG